MGLYFPSKGSRAADFYRPERSIASAGFEPANLVSKDKHANHDTTYATYSSLKITRVVKSRM
jgi:hypothetical protein